MSPLAAYVPRVTQGLLDADVTAATREGTLLIADVSGFTRLAERLATLGRAGAEELAVIVDATFSDLLAAAMAEGGDVVKFGGDALALWYELDGHAERAARAAIGMRESLRRRGPVDSDAGSVRVRVSQGAASGSFAFLLCGGTQVELFVLGPTVSTAVALQSLAAPGEVILSETTAAAIDARLLGPRREVGVSLRRPPPATSPPLVARVGARGLERCLSPPVAARLASGDDDPDHRHVAVGFVHVGGLDRLLRDEGVTEVHTRLDRLMTTATSITAEAGVSLLSTDLAADGAVLIFTAGAPAAVEDPEGAALWAMRRLLDGIDDVELSGGVASGHVFAGDIGAVDRRCYTVMGDTVNLAARLMRQAGSGVLLAHRPAVETSWRQFEFSALEPFFVKGKRRAVEAVAVSADRGSGRPRVVTGPFLGRDAELATVRLAMSEAAAGRGCVVEIEGVAGIGKSRLVDEALADCETRSMRLVGEVFATERPYAVAEQLLRLVADLPSKADPRERGRLLTDFVAARALRLTPYLPLVATAAGATVDPTSAVDQIPPDRRAAVMRDVVAELCGTILDEPRVLVVEDAQWVDDASAMLLARVLRLVPDSRWAVILTRRPVDGGLRTDADVPTTRLTLAPLADSIAAELATVALAETALLEPDMAMIVSRAAGNPLFVMELGGAVAASGSVASVPSTLEALVASHIERLHGPDRRLLRCAAIFGDRFDPEMVEVALADLLPPVSGDRWARLNEFFVDEDDGRRFAHDLVREVAYDSLPYRLRRDVHERVARWLEEACGEVDPVPLSFHFSRARVHERAWHYCRLAGEQAHEQYANVEASAYLGRAIDHARRAGSVDPNDLAAVAEMLGDVSMRAGLFRDAVSGYALARRLHHGDDAAQTRLCMKEGSLRESQGRYGAATRWYRRGRSAAAGMTDPERAAARAELDLGVAGVLLRQGRSAAAVRWCRRAVAEADFSGDRRALAHAYYLLTAALTDLGDQEATRYRDLALPIFEELGDLHGQARVLSNLAVDAVYGGRWIDALELQDRTQAAYKATGDVMGLAALTHNKAELLSDMGRLSEAEPLYREATRIWRAAGYPMGVAAATAGLGRLTARAGRPDEGIALLERARGAAEALGASGWVEEAALRALEATAFAGRWAQVEQDAGRLRDEGFGRDGGVNEAFVLRVRGVARAHLGQRGRATADLRRSAELAGTFAVLSDFELALSLHELSLVTDGDESDEARRRSRDLFEGLGVADPSVLTISRP